MAQSASDFSHCEIIATIYGAAPTQMRTCACTDKHQAHLPAAQSWDECNMSSYYRACMPPYAVSPEYGIDRPVCLYVPSPIVDNNGFMRESIKHRGAMIIDLTQATGPGPNWEQKWINYVNVVNSIKPWRTAGKPFVCDRLWLWTS